MSNKWARIIAKIVVAGGLAGWLVTILGFFGIDWKFVSKAAQEMTTHYILGITSMALLAVSILGIVLLWRGSHITPENIQPRIRDWLDAFKLGTRPITNAHCHFGYEVTLQTGVPIAILRIRDHPRYITLACRVELTEDQKALFRGLPRPEQERVRRDVQLEAAKAKIAYGSDPAFENLTIETRIPITNDLTEAHLLGSLGDINFAALVLIAALIVLLGAPTTPPSLTSHTGARPQSPA